MIGKLYLSTKLFQSKMNRELYTVKDVPGNACEVFMLLGSLG